MKKLTLTVLIATTTWFNQGAIADSSVLSQQTKDGLLLMREEEKLARDVYLTLGAKWQQPVFKQIPNSENRHMSAIIPLLQKYGLADPVVSNDVGRFTNPTMQTLYNQLIDAGDDSLLAALKVGAEIEELDIADLMREMQHTDQVDINQVYDNLTRGSRNHLRAFMRQINNLGGDYQPKHISQALFDEIITSNNERGGNVGRQGQGMGQGKRQGMGQNMGKSQGRGGMVANMPTFAEYDLNGDGKIVEQELNEARSTRISERAQQGYPMKNIANMGSFSEVDTNNDGVISVNEFSNYQAQHRLQYSN